jgi:HEAT repeat protein
VLAGRVSAADVFLDLRPGGVAWNAVEDMLFAARREAPAEGRRRIERFLDEAGFSDRHLDRLAHGDRFERATAAVRLAEHRNPRATPALILAVRDPDRDVRTAATRALGLTGSPEAIDALVETLGRVEVGPSDVSPRVVSGALARFGPDAAEALMPLLSHPAWRVRGAAAFLMGAVQATPAAPRLVERLADTEPDVRAKAAQALGRIGARNALFPLLARLEDPAWLVRMHAVRALAGLGEATSAEPIGQRLFDAHWRVRQEAGIALAGLGHEAHEVLTRALLTGDDTFAREQVVEELQRTPVLRAAVDRVADEVNESAEPTGPAGRLLDAVAETGAYSVLLTAARGHPEPGVRLALVRLLGRHEDERIDSAFREMARQDDDPMVRREADRRVRVPAGEGEGGAP